MLYQNISKILITIYVVRKWEKSQINHYRSFFFVRKSEDVFKDAYFDVSIITIQVLNKSFSHVAVYLVIEIIYLLKSLV